MAAGVGRKRRRSAGKGGGVVEQAFVAKGRVAHPCPLETSLDQLLMFLHSISTLLYSEYATFAVVLEGGAVGFELEQFGSIGERGFPILGDEWVERGWRA